MRAVTLADVPPMTISRLALHLALCALAATLTTAGAQTPASVVARLRAALLPDSGQCISVVRDSAPEWFDGVVVFRGRRSVPPYPSGEDARPRVAAVVISRADTTTITQLQQAGEWWARVMQAPPRSAGAARDAVLALFRMTGLVSSGELVGSRTEALRKVPRRALAKPEAADPITEPRASETGTGFAVEFYGSMPLGLYRYRVFIDSLQNTLRADRELLSPLRMQM